MNEAILRAEGVSKRFAGIQALDGVSLDIRPHEVVGLIGENGAGKSTLLKTLAGICRPDSGRIVLRGRPITLSSLVDAREVGIAMVFQEPSLLPNLSVAENILLGHEDAALRAGFFYDWPALHTLAAAQLAKLDANIPPSARTDTLSLAERQVVELAKALAIEERTQHEPVILLDEPTAMLDAEQSEIVLAQIERLRTRACVVFVSHRLDEVLRVCDRVYVMTNGRCVAQRDRANCQIADLQSLMLGRQESVEQESIEYGQRAQARSPVVRLSVHALCRVGSYHAVSFELHAGEVLGIAGTKGSGRESLCRSLFGAEQPDSGEIVLDGQAIRLSEPADAVQLGIGYVPSERRAEGIVGELSVRENMTLAHLAELRKGPFIDLAREKELVGKWIERLRIKPRTPATPAHHLSGGNQQKLVLAKWLITRTPKILILDHPFCGLDIGAREEVIALMRELTHSGIGILLITDTSDELIALSDNILVMKDGLVSGRFSAVADKPSELQILEQMI